MRILFSLIIMVSFFSPPTWGEEWKNKILSKRGGTTSRVKGTLNNKKKSQERAPLNGEEEELLSKTVDLMELKIKNNSKVKKIDFLTSPIKYMDKKQLQISQGISEFSHSIDLFFGEERIDITSNKSSVRISLIESIIEYEKPTQSFILRSQLVLPNTQSRLNVVIDSIHNEDDEATTLDTNDKESNLGAALRYLTVDNSKWKVYTSLGLKIKLPLNPFAKLRIQRNFKLKKWNSRLIENVFWDELEGTGQKTNLYWDYPIAKTLSLFRIGNTAKFMERKNYFELDHSFSLIHKISQTKGIIYAIGATALSEPSLHVTTYYAKLDYRQRIHKTWLYCDFTPGGSWSRINSFNFIPSLFIKLELQFGG